MPTIISLKVREPYELKVLFRNKYMRTQTCEHERDTIYLAYKNEQVNLRRKDTLSKTHLLIVAVFEHKEENK